MKNKYLEYLGYVLASVLVLFVGFFIFLAFFRGIEQLNKPFPGFLPSYNGYIHQYTLPFWTGQKERLSFPQVITKVEGKQFTNSQDLWDMVKSKPVGTPINYTLYAGFGRGTRDISLETMRFGIRDFIMVYVFNFIGGIICLVSATVLFILRPNRIFSWAIFVSGLMLGGFLGSHCFVYEFINPFFSWVQYYIDLTFVCTIGANFFILSFLVFEEPEFFKNKPWRYSIFYLISFFYLLVSVYAWNKQNYDLFFISWSYVHLSYTFIAFFYLIYVVIHTRYTSMNPTIRQRAKLLLIGLSGGTLSGANGVITLLFGASISYSFFGPPMMLIPFSIVYGALRYNLFEVDEFIKKTFLYTALVLIYSGIAAVILLSLNQNLQAVPYYGTPVFVLLFILFILFILVYFKRRILAILDHLFFRAKYEYENVVEQLTRELSVTVDVNKIIESVDRIIKNNLLLANVEILIVDENKKEYRSVKENLALSENDAIVKVINNLKRLISHNDIINNPLLSKVRNQCMAQMAKVEAAYMLPFFFREKMIGILALGERMSGAESFNTTDLELLNLIGKRTAVSFENVRLYQEMEVARKELEELNQILEDKVKIRTGQLEKRNQELESSNLQISTATQNKSTFLASMSHELRTPLNGILGFSQMVIEGIYGTISDEVKSVMIDLEENGQELLLIINDILDLSKIEAGKMVFIAAEFSPRDTVEIVVGQMAGLAEKKGLKIKGEFAQNLPFGWGEEKRIKQILTTLLRNAIRCSKAEEVKIWVKVQEKDLLFEVEDNGIGIPKDRLEHIFEEHEIKESLELKDYRGIGLGLALSKSWIELFKGKMYAESEMGHGSKFSFSLPLKESIATCLPAGKALPASGEFSEIEFSHGISGKSHEEKLKEIEKDKHLYEDLKGKRILSIEDNPANQKILHDLLIMHDSIVIEAWNGKEGLEKARTEKPDVIITDLQLPEMDGFQVIREIRKDKNPAISKLPIIIASSYAMLDDSKKGIEAGGNMYIAKPYIFKEVLDAIKKLGSQ